MFCSSHLSLNISLKRNILDSKRQQICKHILQGSLETKEYMVSELKRALQLNQEQLCIMAALMGNFLLTEGHLQDFHKMLGITNQLKDNKVIFFVCLDLY